MINARRTLLHALTATGLAAAVAVPVATTSLASSDLAAFEAPTSSVADLAEADAREALVESRKRKALLESRTALAREASARGQSRAAVQAAAAKAAAAKAVQEQRDRDRARASRAARTAPVAPSGSPKAYARSLLASRGMSDQYSCLNSLWNRESGWSVTATNASSGAYGIPQSLPASKMATEGSDYRTNARTQVRWGVKYIASRYGGPCAAWSHSQAHGWY